MQFKSYLNRDIGLIFAVSFLLSLIPTAFADAQNDDSILRDYLNAYPLEHLSYTDCLSEGILPVPPSCTASNIKDACMGMPESIYDIPPSYCDLRYEHISNTSCLYKGGDNLLTVSDSVPRENIPYIEYYLRNFLNLDYNHIPLLVPNIYYGMCHIPHTVPSGIVRTTACDDRTRGKCIPYTGPHLDDSPCSDDKTLILKQTDYSYACVKPSTSEKLVESGWAVDLGIIHDDTVSEIQKTTIIDGSFRGYTVHMAILAEIQKTTIIDGNNQFAMDFYSNISQESNDNIFFSPWSIFNAFAILYEGAAGNTAYEIDNTFGFPADYAKRTGQFKYIIGDLNSDDSKYQLSVANGLWLDDSFVPYPEYVRTINDYYGADARTVDFETDGASIVNDWVKEKTIEKITEILLPDPDLKLAITNAIYFKGIWVSSFDYNLTQDDDFWITPTESVKTPMMHNPEYFVDVAHLDDLSIIKMPYKGDRISMLVLLPDDKDGLYSLEKSLTVESLSEWKNLFSKTLLDVKIPKFKVEAEYDLKEALQKSGINDAFEFTEADLSGIASDDGLHVSQATHKTFVAVNEKGIEAAAGTGISLTYTSGSWEEPPVFHASHPFIFIISDNETDNILFMGRITNPQ